jgi:hypothetical protein
MRGRDSLSLCLCVCVCVCMGQCARWSGCTAVAQCVCVWVVMPGFSPQLATTAVVFGFFSCIVWAYSSLLSFMRFRDAPTYSETLLDGAEGGGGPASGGSAAAVSGAAADPINDGNSGVHRLRLRHPRQATHRLTDGRCGVYISLSLSLALHGQAPAKSNYGAI